MNIKKNSLKIVFFVFLIIFLCVVVKGHKGNPIYYQNEKDTVVGGPFESSNTTSRYVLIEAIVENQTFFFTKEQAQFTSGDVTYKNGKFLSIFTPGISFIGIPFYTIGKFFGLPQLFTFFSTVIFALLNVYLVVKISRKLGATIFESFIGGTLFLFGSNALAYSLTLTQHHGSTFVILLSLLLSVSKRSFITNIILGVLFGIGVMIDIPNAFMMFPIILYVIFKSFEKTEIGEKVKFSLKLNILGLLIGVLPFVGAFFLYNYVTTGSPTLLSQSIGRVDFDENGNPKKRAGETLEKTLYEHGEIFDPRKQLVGFYILFFSNERGVVYYAPVVLIGILGLLFAYKKKENRTLIILGTSVVLVCASAYTMFGDPWGGWSFGPRYLIPAIAIVSTGVGIVLQRYKKNPLFILIFFLLITYSVSVNSLGAFTTNAIPPKVEALNLPNPLPYTYEYNLKLVEENKSSSLIYNLFFYRYSSLQYFLIGFIGFQLMFLIVLYVLSIKKIKGATNEK